MSSGMDTEQAKEYAKTMTYSEAVSNVRYSKGIKYRKATMIKLRELAEIADSLDKANTLQTEVEEICDRADRNCNECWKQLHCRAKDTPQTEEFKNFDREALILLIGCQKERIEELLADKDTPQTERDCFTCKHDNTWDVECEDCDDDYSGYEPKQTERSER